MKRIKVQITAHSPLAIGRQKPGGSISEVETYIPGTVIRGAIAGLMIRQSGNKGDDYEPDGDFKALFVDGGAIFQNAYPALTEVNNRLQVNLDVRVLPATALSAKGKSGFKPKGNGVFDSLIDRFCAEQQGQVYDPSCPHDASRVDPFKGFYSCLEEIENAEKKTCYFSHSATTRLLTRVGINRKRATAEDKILYSTQVLNETKRNENKDVQMVFCGSILVDESKGLAAEDFHQYLEHNANNIRLGGSASRGLGKVSLQLQPPDPELGVGDRWKAFNEMLQGRWQLWQMFDRSKANPTNCRTFFTIGLQSDAILSEQWQRSTVISAALLQAAVKNLPGDVKLEVAYSSYDYRSGWNSAWGLMKDTELITDRGSVYLFSVDKDHEPAWINALTDLENRGIGDRTMEGFGQVRICDEFHCVLRETAV
jgi:CRISPR-associated protein Csx10